MKLQLRSGVQCKCCVATADGPQGNQSTEFVRLRAIRIVVWRFNAPLFLQNYGTNIGWPLQIESIPVFCQRTTHIHANISGIVTVLPVHFRSKSICHQNFMHAHSNTNLSTNTIQLIRQGKSQDAALQNLYTLYWPVLKANWSYLSLLVFINIKFVPPIVSKPVTFAYDFNQWIGDNVIFISFVQFRVLIGNLIGFGWVIFLTMKRRKLQQQLDTAKKTRIIVTNSDSSSSTGASKKKPRNKDTD